MATRRQGDHEGSWLLAKELFERGDPAFVDEVRRLHDPARLGTLAAQWYADVRPEARQLLCDYLDQPLNAFRHEPLVKCLFKLVEQAADDPLMARFLVALDRSERRVRRKRIRYDASSGATWTEESIRLPSRTTLPRSTKQLRYRNPQTGEPMAARTVEAHSKLRLFSVHTRHYLRRRVWRYFRNLGKQHPDRYLPAIGEALKQYSDADVADGLALLDNWGLVHVLFHHCPALVAKAHGWTLADGHTLAELTPAPIFEPLWQTSAAPLLDVLKQARCRPVRQWAMQMLRRHHADAVARLPLPEILTLLGHEDAELSRFAAEALRQAPALASLSVEQWLALLDTTNPQTLDILCELMAQRLDANTITLEQAARLASSRPVPVARLGLTWLQSKQPATLEQCRTLLTLGEAEAESVRAELVRWARRVLSSSPHFQAEWVLEFLDGRYADVREEGWVWFHDETRAHEEVMLWQRLLETPYDDIRLRLVAMLEERVARQEPMPPAPSQLDPELLRFLWASVLLNIHRGGRSKPLVVGQMIRRLERRPEEAPVLLPILSVALRSVRGPEWRAGLAGIVQLLERSPESEPAVRSAFPELKLALAQE
jgi:hypothetical protein